MCNFMGYCEKLEKNPDFYKLLNITTSRKSHCVQAHLRLTVRLGGENFFNEILSPFSKDSNCFFELSQDYIYT